MQTGIIMGIFLVASGFITLQNFPTVNEASSNTQDYDLDEGTYYIKSMAGSHKYLDVSWSCKDASVCQVQLWSLGNTTTNDKWVIKRAGLPLISPYTLQSVCNNKYLTGGDRDGFIPTVTDRYLVSSRGRQEWRFKWVNSMPGTAGIFKIYTEEHGKYLDVVNSCASDNGCKVQMWSDGSDISRQWYLVKL